MAFTLSSVGSGTDTAADATLASGATITASVGDVLLLCIAACNSGASGVAAVISSIADDAGSSTNVYTQRGTTGNQTAGAANDGASQFFYECPVTTALSNNIITVTFSANNAQKAFEVFRIQPGAGETVTFQSVGTAVAGAARTVHAATVVSVTSGDTIFCMAAIETDDAVSGDGDTTNGNWSAEVTRLADGGADAATMSCSAQYKTVNATGNQTWGATTGVGRDSVSNHIIYRPVATPKSIVAGGGSYTLTGTDASPELGRKVAAGGGSYALTGTDATLAKGQKLVADGGSYSLTGTDATLRHAWKIVPDAGSYSLTGTDATLRRNLPLVAGAGSYALTGTDASPEHGWKVTADAGSYTLAGTDASPLHAWKLAADGGAYALTGTDATLTYTPGVGAYTIAADGGSYSLTGTDASLVVARKLVADNGNYALTGTDATLTYVPVETRARGGDDGGSARPVRQRRKYRHITAKQLQELLDVKPEEAPVPTHKRVRAVKREIVRQIEAAGLLGPAKPAVAKFVQQELTQAFVPQMDWAALAAAVRAVMQKAAEEAARIEQEIEDEDELFLILMAA